MSKPTGSESVEVIRFDEITPVMCPCGPSRRWKLHRQGYGLDIHRTTIHGQAEPHKHLNGTVEIYYVLWCEPGAKMRVGDQDYDLSQGMAITVPLDVMHSVDGYAEMLILVIGGHDDKDFFDAEGRPLN